MRDDNDTIGETGSPTDRERPRSGQGNECDRPKLRAVAGKDGDIAKGPPGSTRFAKGNKAAAGRAVKRLAKSRLEVLEEIAIDVLVRISVREYRLEQTAGGRPKRKLIRIDASAANASANLIKTLMDLEAQRAGEELRKLTSELEELRVIVGGMLDARRS